MKFLDVPQSGSFAGVTHSRNRFGQYRRTRAIPVNPNTTAQGNARGLLADMSAAWRGITEAQRTAWRALASLVELTNSLGQTFTPTGHQLFVKINTVRLLISEVMLSDPPATFAFEPQGTSIVTADASASTLTVGQSGCPTSPETYMVYCSPQRSPGRFFEGDYRLIANVAPANLDAGQDIGAAYESRLGNLVAGNKIFVKIVQAATEGWQDVGTFTSCIVVA